MIGQAPICVDCIHLHEDDKEGFRCDAFLEGIPFSILWSEYDHTKPYPGDHGIQFEAKSDDSS